jgi:TonB family protein
VNMLQMLVETLLFYHPAVWWASRRIRIERELCCDDVAVQFSGNALRYARALTIIEKLRLTAPNVVMASTGGSLLYRIQRLVGVPEKEYGTSRLPTVLALCAGILCLAMNVSWISAQDAPGVKVDLGSSSVIHRTPVQYPESAQKQKITGTVQVEVKLDASGDVADARVLTGPEELRKAALQSVLGWHFTSDAARSTRVIQISFSDRGTSVQVGEPYTFQGQTVVLADEAKRVELAKIAKIELTRAQEAQINKEQEVELNAVRAQRQQLEAQMAALRAQMADMAKAADRDRIDPKISEIQLRSLEAQLAAVKAQFDSTQPLIAKVVTVGSVVANRTLKGIATPGLSDSARNDLISKLPVRVGDVLSEATLKQTDAAIRAYDEHLLVQFLATPDGQAEIRVSAPGRR